VKNTTPNFIFEFGDTEKSKAFVTRNPQFPAALVRLFTTANRCFGGDPHAKNQLGRICFWLGHTCRQDFVEVVFLAVNGYGAGATKILRSLYERAVYCVPDPEPRQGGAIPPVRCDPGEQGNGSSLSIKGKSSRSAMLWPVFRSIDWVTC
jgi:hypothetical protein